MIQLQSLNKYFNRRKSNEIHVIDNISLQLPEKGLVVLLGPSGSGKTTLLNVIGGLDSFHSGQVNILSTTFKKYQSKKWDQLRNLHIGYIFQNYHLLPNMSVMENVAYTLRLMGIQDEALIEEKVSYVLKAVNMYALRKKQATQLSGGQQQRVAIARALVKNPDIVIADEPTGNLDSANTIDIMNIIKTISKQKLVVLVTHEKEIAQFYADRIIELKDGQIISDIEQHTDVDFEMKQDETIYLKDLHQKSLLEEQQHISLYHDGQLPTNLDVQIIIKNNSIYLKVNSEIKKVKLLDETSTIQIKDAHYIKKTKEQLTQTSFDTSYLNTDAVAKKHHKMISFKESFIMALERLIQTTKRGKIMLFSFVLAGLVMAYAVSTLTALLVVQPEPNLTHPISYVILQPYLNEDPNLPTYEALQEIDDINYINTLNYGMFYFVQPNGRFYSYSIFGYLSLTDSIDDPYVLGHSPLSDHEIVISALQASDIISSAGAQEIGIWTYEDLLNETLRINDVDVTISGIIQSDIKSIYVTRNLSNTIVPTYYQAFVLTNIEMQKDLILIKGNAPVGEQLVVSSAVVPNFDSVTFPYLHPLLNVTISGVFESNSKSVAYATNEYVEKVRYDNIQSIYLDVKDKSTVISSLENYDIEVIDLYEQTKQQMEENQQLFAVSSYSTTLIIIGFAGLGFYFVIRSSLLKRQYDISIKRAIGVYQQDIFSAFMIEVLILTTISTLIGYILGTYGIYLLSQTVIGDFNLFKVTWPSVLLGIVLSYALNLFTGLLPVVNLLKKTPAKMLSEYDM
jgi:putative ABC transport system permease protein